MGILLASRIFLTALCVPCLSHMESMCWLSETGLSLYGTANLAQHKTATWPSTDRATSPYFLSNVLKGI